MTDYIFVLDPVDTPSDVAAYLAFPPASELEPGLPQTNKCSSDHLALMAELVWKKKNVVEDVIHAIEACNIDK